MPKISVIIPTYNRCQTLHRCIQSVLEQSFQDLELVIVNDGSTDNTASYLSNINDQRIKAINLEQNRGGNYARNKGIEASNGDFLAFCDDDDYWLEDKLEKQYVLLEAESIDLCYCGINTYTHDGTLKQYTFHGPKYKDLHKAIMDDNFIGAISSVIVRKSLVTEVGGFDPALPALQDWDLFIKLMARGCTVKGLNQPLVNYTIVDEKRSITCNVIYFKRAAKYLCDKFHQDPHNKLLARRMNIIFLKRMLKSRQFLYDAILYYWKRLGD